MSAAVRNPDDGWPERTYARLGRRYPLLLLGIAAASIAILTIVGSFLGIPYLTLGLGEWAEDMLVVVPWMGLVGVAAEGVVSRHIAPLRRWAHGDRSDPTSAWRAGTSGIRRGVLLGGLVVIAGSIPAIVYVLRDQGIDSIVAGGLGVWALIAVGAGVHLVAWERALRPVVFEIAQQLPEGFEDLGRTGSLSVRLMIVVPMVSMLTAVATAAAIPEGTTPELRTLAAVAIWFGVTAIVALPITALLRRSLIGPLEILLAAMRRVRDGDLNVSLPVLAADEVGAIAVHFNEMMEGLRERDELREDLRESRARIVAAADAGRRQVERDLHDGAQQQLILLRLKLGMIARSVAEDPERARLVEEASQDLTVALADLRNLAHGVYPAVLEANGLGAALEQAVQRVGKRATVRCEGLARHDQQLEAAIYFCCLEALQNAAKHAGEDATVVVTISERDAVLEFEVADDGAGYEVAATGGSGGLQNMRDRMGALGGTLSVDSAPGRGTRVRGTVPLGVPSAG